MRKFDTVVREHPQRTYVRIYLNNSCVKTQQDPVVKLYGL